MYLLFNFSFFHLSRLLKCQLYKTKFKKLKKRNLKFKRPSKRKNKNTKAKMDLSNPVFDSVLQIDSRLRQLQDEVTDLEQVYGFSTNAFQSTLNSKKKTNLTKPNKLDHRYKNLNADKTSADNIEKKIIINPSVTQKWTENFQKKPDFMKFYKKEQSDFDEKDFKINSENKSFGNNLLEKKMEKFGLCI